MTTHPPLEKTSERSRTSEAGLLEAVLSALSERGATGPDWLRTRRAEAAAFLFARGFPGPKEEAWRFTPLRTALRPAYGVVTKGSRPANGVRVEPVYSGGHAAALLVDGAPGISRNADEGLEVRSLAEVLGSEPERWSSRLGGLAPVRDGFVAMNDALFDDGLLVRAMPGGARRVHVAHFAGGSAPLAAASRVLVVAEPGSELELVETHAVAGGAPHFESAVTEVWVGRGARVRHVRVIEGAAHASRVSTIAVRVDADGRYDSHVFGFGGALSRETLDVELEGEGAGCSLEGLYVANDGDLVDHHTMIVHGAPRGTSRERYKGVVAGRGTAVFDGTILVRAGASKTEAHQENRNLLLSPDGVVHAKPHLEIDTDDVRCSHGATVGRLDPAQLFYLRSRGIGEETARAALTVAFAREMIPGTLDARLHALLVSSLSAALPGGAMAKELW